MTNNLPVFSSALLSIDNRTILAEKTARLRTLKRQTAQNAIEMGAILLEVKELLPKGQFEDYLEIEFGRELGYSLRSARNFMNCARCFSGKVIDEAIAPSVLYLLANPSTPEDARMEVLELAEAGEYVPLARAKEIVIMAQALPAGVVASEMTIDIQAIDPPDEQILQAPGELIIVPKIEVIPAVEVEQEYYLPPRLLDAIKQIRAWFDMDLYQYTGMPNVPCDRGFTGREALAETWSGSVFLVLPEKDPERWIAKLINSSVRVGLVLAPAQTDRLWFQQLGYTANAFCLLGDPLDKAVFYFGAGSKNFIEVFCRLGLTCKGEV